MSGKMLRLRLNDCNRDEVMLYSLEEQNILKIKYLDKGFFCFWNCARDLGLMDRYGRIILTPGWDDIYIEAEYGVIRASRGKTTVLFDLCGHTLVGLPVEKLLAMGNGVAVKDVDGNIRMMRELSAFSEGLARCYQDKITYYIDAKGVIDLMIVGFECGDFHDGLAAFRKRNGLFKRDTYGFVNRDGEFAVPAKYRGVRNFQDGVAVVEGEQGKHFIGTDGVSFSCYTVKDGERTENPFPNHVGDFINGYAVGLFLGQSRSAVLDGVPITIPLEESGYAVVHKSGRITTTKRHNRLISTGIGDLFLFNPLQEMDESKCLGIMDSSGKVLLEPEYDHIEPYGDRYFVLEKNGEFGLADRHGHVITKPQWEKLLLIRDGTFNVCWNGQWGVMDVHRNWVYELGEQGPYILDCGLVLVGKEDRYHICNRKLQPALNEDVAVWDVLHEGLLLVQCQDQFWVMDYGFSDF